MKNVIINGFKFGMLLQIAVGPICIFIFQTACKYGFFMGEIGVWAAVLVDAFYILAAIWGVGYLIEKNEKAKIYLKVFGVIVLIIFGISNILGAFNISFIPSFNLQHNNSNNIFITTLVLTLSNPLTIVFWAGVFSSKIIEEEMSRKDMYVFGGGAILSTLFFLTLISFLGKITNRFLSVNSIKILNIIVGCLLIYFAIKLILNRDEVEEDKLEQ